MMKRNGFRAYRLIELTLLGLLLLSPLEETHAIDSTPKLRGKDNDQSPHLSQITHEESSMLDEAQVHGLKNDFLEQAKMASDHSLSMTSISGKPDGAPCTHFYECESQRCKEVNGLTGAGECWSPSCFSSTSMVNHMSHGLIPISDINIGDYIQSHTDGSFSRVYAFKKNNHKDTEFYQLQSRTGTLLELTDRHMVFLKNKSLPIAARDVRVGDVLKSGNPEDDTEVVKIEVIHREGYYNPFTESGTLVLNDGVVASSYDVSSSSSSDFFDGPTEMLHWHTLAHVACAPLRFVCKTMNFDVCSDSGNQNEDGLHKFILFLTTLRKLKDWQQVAVVPIAMIMGVLFTVFDLVYDKAEALLEVASSTGVGAGTGFLTFSLVAALAVPGMLALHKRYFL